MSKKNSNVNLKNGFQNYDDLSKVFLNFKDRLNALNKKSYGVAVSGGPDSLALVALSESYKIFNNIRFYYILIDHGLRKNSYLEAKQVKALLKKKNINLKIFQNKEKITKNIQAQARNARYKIISDYCKKKSVKVVLTAHNFEDQVETFFMRLSRGSGLKGLAAMKPLSKLNSQVSLYRPLLDTKKKFLKKISKNIFGKYVIDPSNKNTKFLRTKVRNLRKSLEKSGIKYDQVFKSIQNLSLSKITLDEYLNKTFKELIKKRKKEILINFEKYAELNKDTKIAVINESIKKLKRNYYDLRSKKVGNLINNLNKENFKKYTLGGCLFFKKGDNLCLKIEKT